MAQSELISMLHTTLNIVVTEYTNYLFHFDHVNVQWNMELDATDVGIIIHHNPIRKVVEITWDINGIGFGYETSGNRRWPLQYTTDYTKGRFFFEVMSIQAAQQTMMTDYMTNILNALVINNNFLNNPENFTSTNLLVIEPTVCNNLTNLEIYGYQLTNVIMPWIASWYQQCVVVGSQKVFPTPDTITFMTYADNTYANCCTLLDGNKLLIQTNREVWRGNVEAQQLLDRCEFYNNTISNALTINKDLREFAKDKFILES